MPNLDIIFTILLYLFPFLVTFLATVIVIQLLQKKGQLSSSLSMSLLLVTMPKDGTDEAQKNVKEFIGRAEQLYSVLGSIKVKKKRGLFEPSFYLALEIAATNKEIKFYIATPKALEESVMKHVQGVYPEAEIDRVDDYNIFNSKGFEVASQLALKSHYSLPIKTYTMLEADPLGGITNALSRIKEGEGAAIQIVFRPEQSGWRTISQKIAREMQKGKSFSAARSEASKGILNKMFRGSVKPAKSEEQKRQEAAQPTEPITPMQQEMIKSIEEKAAKKGFGVNIRLVTSATSKERAEELSVHMESTLAQFDSPGLNGFKFSSNGTKKIAHDFIFRNHNPRQKMILNTEELASIFHLPLTSTETPNIKWLKSKSAAPPIDLPSEGLILGKNNFRGEETQIRISDDDRRRHFYVVGQTGTGKSSMLQEMVRQDIESGRGVCVIDPHGDMVDKILGIVPENRVEDVVLFDPSDLETPIGLNMLEYDTSKPEQKTFIVNEMMGIFQKLFGAVPESMGPMFEQYARNAILLLLDNPQHGFTLMDVPRVLTDHKFRQFLLSKETNLIVKEFWTKEAEKAGGEAALENVAPYINSKFNIFIANDYMRPIIGQSRSGLDFREIMDGQKILLVNLAKGKLGDINSSLLGLIVVGKILLSSFARVDMPEEERKDFYLYIDEFQNFTTDSIVSILAEARKYRLDLIIAHQFIAQLQDNIRDAVFGNVGSLASFRLGAEDTEIIAKQLNPVFGESDLLNIDNYNAYAKLLVNGNTSRPFNMKINLPVQGSKEVAAMVRDYSIKKYGKPRAEVEREILDRAKVAESESAD